MNIRARFAILAVAAALSATLVTIADNSDSKPLPAALDYRKALAECGQTSGEVDRCVRELVMDARDRGDLRNVLEALAISDGEVIASCTKLFRSSGARIASSFREAAELVSATDVRACLNTAAESSYQAWVTNGAEQSLLELAAACAARVGLVVDGKTPACAKGVGWAVAMRYRNVADSLQTCRELYDRYDPANFQEALSVGYDRLYYGCANAVMVAHHGPHHLAEVEPDFLTAIQQCLTDQKATYQHPYGMSDRNGCAGGTGAAYGMWLINDHSPEHSNDPTEILVLAENLLEGCQRLEQPDGTGDECATQVIRQAAFLLFGSLGLDRELCALASRIGPSTEAVCITERDKFRTN